MQNRRNFLSKISIASVSLFALSSFKQKTSNKKMKNVFIHHVYFWLNNADSAEDRNKLIEGLTKLAEVKTINQFHIGKPADTNRPGQLPNRPHSFKICGRLQTFMEQGNCVRFC
jgi:hypothetical protein